MLKLPTESQLGRAITNTLVPPIRKVRPSGYAGLSMKALLLIAGLVMLTSCRPANLIEKWTDPKARAIADQYVERLIKGDPSLAAELAPQYRNGPATDVITRMSALIPKETPISKQVVGYYVTRSPGGTSYDVTYQFGYKSKWLLIMTGWHELPGGGREIITLRVQPLEASLQELNALTFKHASPWHYFFALGVIVIPAFVLTTLVICIRTKFAGRKWPWIIIILLGVMQATLNWTTGQIRFSPLTVLLFGASAFSPGLYGPWLLSMGIPVGAIAFWVRRKNLRRADSSSPPV